MKPDDIEATLVHQAEVLGVSADKLRAVFSRGVRECLTAGYVGQPSTHGLARVQRFSTAMKTGNTRLTPDADFMPDNTEHVEESESYEIFEDSSASWTLIYDAMSRNGEDLETLFPRESIEQVVFDKSSTELAVLGTHGSVQWSCTLNLTSGECTFVTNVD